MFETNISIKPQTFQIELNSGSPTSALQKESEAKTQAFEITES